VSVATLNDPSGTGYNLFNPNGGRADTVPVVSPYSGQSINQWINPNAFVDPANNIGRFGDATSGDVVRPGTEAVSLSLIKRFTIRERIRAEIGMQVANAFNHANYAPPNVLTLGESGFGQSGSRLFQTTMVHRATAPQDAAPARKVARHGRQCRRRIRRVPEQLGTVADRRVR
jgi:hypothetical protein